MKKRIPLLIILWMTLSSLIAATPMRVVPLSASNRIPKDIKEVFMDNDGFIWYITDSGLYQDDGYHTTCYRADIHQPDLMKSNHITCLSEDTCGHIWIGTRRGAYVLDKHSYELQPVADAEVVDHVVNTLNATRNGKMWLSTNEYLLQYDARGKLLARYPINHKVQQLYEDSHGNIWRILWREGLARYDAVRDSFVTIEWPFAEHPAYMVEHRTTGSYWVSVWERGVLRYTPQADSLKQFVWQETLPPSDRKLFGLHPWLNGQYLCGNLEDGRLLLYEVTKTDTLRRLTDAEADQLIPCGARREYVHVKADADDCLWLTETDRGIQAVERHKGNGITHRHLGEATPVALITSSEGCWLQDGFTRKYHYWNMRDDALARLPNSDKIIAIQKARTRQGIYAARKYNDMARFYTENGQVRVESLFTYTLMESERVRTFHEDASNRFWLGTNRRLLHYDAHTSRLQPVEGVQGIVLSITSDRQGRIYAITEGRQMYRIAAEGQSPVRAFALHEDFSSLRTSPDGDVWGITQQGGIYLFSQESDHFVSFTDKMGLTGEAVVDMAFDRDGRIWLLYNDRLVIYDPDGKDEMPRFINATSPTLGMEALWSLHLDESGNMHVGGTKGIAMFDPARFAATGVQVPLHLTAMQTDGERHMVPLYKGTETLQLAASDDNVRLFFSTLKVMDAEMVRMAWRYQGQQAWALLPEGNNEIHLTGLGRGEHQIEVRATTPDGVWGTDSLELTVHRPWPWYFNRWARVFYFLIVCGLIVWGKKRTGNGMAAPQITESPQSASREDGNEVCETNESSIFLNQVTATIKAHLGDADYSIEDLSRDLCMSRASLHRKVKAASGITPTELMRTERLNRAAELLKEGKLNVNEVAYSVGFSTPGYFTQSFKKQFGVLPSEFR